MGDSFQVMTNNIPTRREIENLRVYVPGKSIEETQKELGLERVIKLASNENPFGFSPLAKAAMMLEMEHIHLYPEGMAHKLTEKLGNRLHVDRGNIIVGNGSDEIIRLLTRSYMQAGDEAVLADVTFSRYETNILIEGGVPVKIPLIAGVHDLEGMLNAISDKTRMVFICNPNNPTGTIVEKRLLQAFIHNVPKRVLVVIDEAYHEYVTDEAYLQTIPFIGQYPNLVILRTFSKVYGLAALRVGYGIMHQSIVRELAKVKEPFNSNRMAQAAAIASLDDVSFVNLCVRKNAEAREILCAEFDRMGLKYFPSQGNFIMVHLRHSGDEVFQALLKQGIIVRSGSFFGYPETIRVSIGTEAENLEFITELKKIIE